MHQHSDSAWKVAYLLRLPPKSSIVVGGSQSASLCEGLARLGYRAEQLTHRTRGDSFRALLLMPGVDLTPEAFNDVLGSADEQAQVLAFFKHRWAAFAGVRAGVRSMFGKASYGRGQVSRLLQRTHWQLHSTWLPLPKLSQAEEFVAFSERDEVGASLGVSQAFAGAVRARLHDGFGIYACKGSAGIDVLADALLREVSEQLGVRSFRITRFDLRERGALVLFLKDDALRKSYVCRIVRLGAAAERIQRHWDLQARVKRAAQALPDASRMIPETLSSFELGDYRVWLEERAPGTVSWRLPHSSRPKLDTQLIDFLAQLAQLTGVQRVVEEKDIERESNMWSDEVGPRLPQDLRTALTEAVDRLRVGLVGRQAVFGWVHGDYGYGNVLASPDDARVSSVIDWETASCDSFIGVDLFNFLMQRARSAAGASVAAAAAMVMRDIQTRRMGARELGEYCGRFLPDRHVQLMVMGITLCRWVLREHRYTVTAGPDAKDLCEALAEFKKAVDQL